MSIELIPGASISSSGLDAERKRMQITANNIANARSTRGENGKPYIKKLAVFSTVYKDAVNGSPVSELGGVKLAGIIEGKNPTIKVYQPEHPDADGDGMVEMPNISPIEEMLDMITATRAYEANLSALKQSREMAEKTISMSKGG